MIELRTLGEVALRGTDQHELCSILAQPKRLALLTYLAVSRRWQRRDSVVALFWPGLDTNHARGALRQAVRFLRRQLGDGVLRGRTDEELGFVEGGLWCDASAFERACETGDLSEALRLYRGDFLAGLFVSGAAPEFDYWLDAQRHRFRSLAVEAARTLSNQRAAAGDDAAAMRWGRQALELSPMSEHTLRWLITLLERLGDRVAALDIYDGFMRRLGADEFEPSPETLMLIQSIARRARPSIWQESPELALARAWFSAGWCGSCAVRSL